MYVPLAVKSVLAAGLLSRHFDGQSRAIETLTTEIDDIERDLANTDRLVFTTIYQQIQQLFPLDSATEQLTLDIRLQRDAIRGILAALYLVRSLLHEDLEQWENSLRDRTRVQELGFDEQDMLKALPTKYGCLKALDSAMVYFDTRGYVESRLPWDDAGLSGAGDALDQKTQIGSYKKALSDFELSLRATRTMKAALGSSLYNLPEFSPESIEAQKQYTRRTEAVVLFHRMQTHQRAGNQADADADAAAIRTLGFDPEGNLY